MMGDLEYVMEHYSTFVEIQANIERWRNKMRQREKARQEIREKERRKEEKLRSTESLDQLPRPTSTAT